MELSSVKGLIEKIKEEREERYHDEEIGFQFTRYTQPDHRLAFGYSTISKNNYQLELRVQGKDRMAFKKAQAYKEAAKGEANIKIIPEVSLPRRKDMRDERASFFHQKRKKDQAIVLHIGSSICHKEGGSGTLGAFVNTDWGIAVLSNSHVLALVDRGARGKDFTYHPTRQDTNEQLRASHRIALLKDYTEFSESDRNTHDSAIALLMEDCEYTHTSNQIPVGFGFADEGRMLEFNSTQSLDDLLLAYEDVGKIGRTTGQTFGKITGIDVQDLTLRVPGGKNYVFTNLIEITSDSKKPFTKAGDSGSLVYIDDELYAIGLHFAGGILYEGRKKYCVSYCCRLDEILKFYNDMTLLD